MTFKKSNQNSDFYCKNYYKPCMLFILTSFWVLRTPESESWSKHFFAIFNFFFLFKSFSLITEKRIKINKKVCFYHFLLLFKAGQHTNAG